MCFQFFLYCTSGNCLSKGSLQLLPYSVFTSCNPENKRTYSAQVRRYCVLLKKIITHYTEIIFLSKNLIFFYILKIFFTMLHLKIFLKYWIILYIFRISLCVTSPLKTPILKTSANGSLVHNVFKSIKTWPRHNWNVYFRIRE